jgi:hypothetical protein
LYNVERETLLKVNLAFFANTLDRDDRLSFWTKVGLGSGTGDDILRLFQSVELLALGHNENAVACTAEVQNGEVASLHLLLAATLAVTHKAIDGAQAATDDARVLASIMRAVASQPGRPERWRQCADLLESGVDPQVRSEDVARIVGARGPNDVLVTAGLVLVGSRADQSPKVAVFAHIRLAMLLLQTKQMFMPMFRRLFLPFAFAFWKSLATRSGFLFVSPSLVRAGIADAEAAPVRTQAQRLFGEIVSGLGMSVPAEVSSWLNEK